MTYDSSGRRAKARTTRARVIEVAKDCFLARGFGGTTIRQIAEDAEVSEATIYKSFGGKAALLKAVYDVTLAGDADNIPFAARPEAIAVRDAPTPASAATAYAELASVISQRLDPLLRVLLGALDTDKDLADFGRIIETERHVGSSFYVRQWSENGWLRPDLTLEQAIDTLWALNSPQPRWLLLDHGWSEDRFTGWLADLFHHAIFAPDPTGREHCPPADTTPHPFQGVGSATELTRSTSPACSATRTSSVTPPSHGAGGEVILG